MLSLHLAPVHDESPALCDFDAPADWLGLDLTPSDELDLAADRADARRNDDAEIDAWIADYRAEQEALADRIVAQGGSLRGIAV